MVNCKLIVADGRRVFGAMESLQDIARRLAADGTLSKLYRAEDGALLVTWMRAPKALRMLDACAGRPREPNV